MGRGGGAAGAAAAAGAAGAAAGAAGAADAPGVKSANLAQSLSSSTMIATSSPTLTSVAPAGLRILATCPSSIDSAPSSPCPSRCRRCVAGVDLIAHGDLPLGDVTLGHRRGQRGHRDLLVRGICGGGRSGGDGSGGIAQNGAPRVHRGETRRTEISPLGTRGWAVPAGVRSGFTRLRGDQRARWGYSQSAEAANDPEYDRYAPARATTLFGATRASQRQQGGSGSDSAAWFAVLAIAVASAATAVAARLSAFRSPCRLAGVDRWRLLSSRLTRSSVERCPSITTSSTTFGTRGRLGFLAFSRTAFAGKGPKCSSSAHMIIVRVCREIIVFWSNFWRSHDGRFEKISLEDILHAYEPRS